MIYRALLILFSLIILQGCSVSAQKVNLKSGIQYIGLNEKIQSGLKKLDLSFERTSNIDLSADNKKIILIDAGQIREINKNEVKKALEQGFYVFFINVFNDKEIQSKFFHQTSYEVTKDYKPWAEQIYTQNGDLKHLNISTKGSIADNLSRWLVIINNLKHENN